MVVTLSQAGLNSAHRWIIDHDKSRVFNVLYVGLAIILSVFVSLFWLVLIVGIHFAFEIVRHYHHSSKPMRRVLGRSLWHLKLDLSFIAFSFVVDAYMGFLFGVAGLGNISRVGAISRVGVRSGARLGGYEGAIRGIMLSADDIARTTSKAVGLRGSMKGDDNVVLKGDDAEVDDANMPGLPDSKESPFQPELVSQDAQLEVTWARKDYATLAFGVICITLLLLTPWLIGMTYEELLGVILLDLQPFPT